MDAVSWVVAAVIVNINWDSETWCQFFYCIFQVEKFTKWLTHTNWWRNCAYANFLLKSFILNYTALRSHFRRTAWTVFSHSCDDCKCSQLCILRVYPSLGFASCSLKNILNGWLLVCKPADMVATKDSSVWAYERLCLLTCARNNSI